MKKLLGLVIALAVLSLVFGLLEYAFGPRPPTRRRPGVLKTDLAYWFFTPVVTRAVTRGSLVLAAVLIAVFVGRDTVRSVVTQGWGLVPTLPPGVQALLALALGDFVGYWLHRLFHRGWLWRVHAVHHSPRALDWLAANRVHPLNDVLTRAAQGIVLLGLGFPANVLAVYVPFIGFYALYLHADVTWDYGPFRAIIASPRFHRWHHTSEEEGRDKNFAGFFPVWDILSGTYYMPRDRAPAAFGAGETRVPDGLFAQLAFPFRRERPVASEE